MPPIFQGLAATVKKKDRLAFEGSVGLGFYVHDSQSTVALVELNSETDFVARNEKFKSLLTEISQVTFVEYIVTVFSPFLSEQYLL